MYTVPPGSLIKHQRAGDSTLLVTPPSRRLTDHLHDLIIIAYERSTNRRSKSLGLTRLEYVSGENKDGKYSMRLNALVREQDRDASVALHLTITVSEEDWLLCSQHS